MSIERLTRLFEPVTIAVDNIESRVELPAIGEVLIRPIRPDDGDLIVALFDTLSPRSVYYRFFSPLRELSAAMLVRFTQIDYDREIALVAVQAVQGRETMLGAARIMLQHNLIDAEFSVLIGDPWQGKGIGAKLLETCIHIARRRGFRKIWGVALAENKGMLALGRKLGFTIRRSNAAGEYDLSLDLSAVPAPGSVCAAAS
jgi:acetyltransferase